MNNELSRSIRADIEEIGRRDDETAAAASWPSPPRFDETGPRAAYHDCLEAGDGDGALELLGEIQAREQAAIAAEDDSSRHFALCAATLSLWRRDYLIVLALRAWNDAAQMLDEIHDLEQYMLDQLMNSSGQ